MNYLILAVLCVIIIGIIICDSNRFVSREYVIKSNKITTEYRFCVISDLHGKEFGVNNQKLLKAIQIGEPEAVFVAGDIITAKPNYNNNAATKFIQKLSEDFTIFYGSGNHEYRYRIYKETYGDASQLYENSIKRPSVIRLYDGTSNVLKNLNIEVKAVEIDREYYKKINVPNMDTQYLNHKIGKVNDDAYTILIAHNPEYFKQYANYGADLTLSGHVHGGVAKLPFLGGVISPKLRFFPKYDGGLYEQNNKYMILSRGLSAHTIPIRFLNPGELIFVTLKPEK